MKYKIREYWTCAKTVEVEGDNMVEAIKNWQNGNGKSLNETLELVHLDTNCGIPIDAIADNNRHELAEFCQGEDDWIPSLATIEPIEYEKEE